MGGTMSGKLTTEGSKDNMNTDSSAITRTIQGLYECRKAYHSGSWYDDNQVKLHNTLESFLNQAEQQQQQELIVNKTSSLRAVICPHAGYTYSGPTAAYSYNALYHELIRPKSQITQIVVLHPSHHIPLRGQCAVSGARILETPLGPLHVDHSLRNEIMNRKSSDKKYTFTLMKQQHDEEEHSGEMQYPYIAYILQALQHKLQTNLDSDNISSTNITVTPIMCGSLTTNDEIAYGTLLSNILHRSNVLTIVSSDFCHWGRRFGYQPIQFDNIHMSSTIPIYQIIEQMDQRGMDIIASQQPGAFATYICETNNTICGRHAIAVYLRALTTTSTTESTVTTSTTIHSNSDAATLPKQPHEIQFIKYAQSSQVTSLSDSSVSYAAAIVTS